MRYYSPYTLDPEDEDERREHVDGDEDRDQDVDELQDLGLEHVLLPVVSQIAEVVLGGFPRAQWGLGAHPAAAATAAGGRDVEESVVERGGRLLRVRDGRYRPDEDHGGHQLRQWSSFQFYRYFLVRQTLS